MAEATTSTAVSIEMLPIPPTLSRRDAGLRSAEIGYDEERAESTPGVRAEREGHWTPYHIPKV